MLFCQFYKSKDTVFVYNFSFMPFLKQSLIYARNTWFKFVFGSFFEQNHLLNLIILGVYEKRWPKWARISK